MQVRGESYDIKAPRRNLVPARSPPPIGDNKVR
jgi:hypothetical protein